MDTVPESSAVLILQLDLARHICLRLNCPRIHQTRVKLKKLIKRKSKKTK